MTDDGQKERLRLELSKLIRKAGRLECALSNIEAEKKRVRAELAKLEGGAVVDAAPHRVSA